MMNIFKKYSLFGCFIGILGMLIIGCSVDEQQNDINDCQDCVYLSGEVFINDTIELNNGIALVVLEGASLHFGPDGILIVNGDVTINGTESNPINIFGSQERISHRVIQVKWDAEVFEVAHTNITDGLVTSVADWNHMSEVTFTNTKELVWNDAMARFWSSTILIENCRTFGNNKGEGILMHNMVEPIVRNCTFFQTPDAVEYINCNNGIITGNTFTDIADDAIDQNGCHNTIITNNKFNYVLDRALEIGSENFGRSIDIVVDNNLFVDCNAAVSIRQSSNVQVSNSTFYNCGIVLDVDTPQDSLASSMGYMESCVLANTKDADVRIIGNSLADIKSSMSESELGYDTSNTVSDIIFLDSSNDDFTIVEGDFPSGFTADNIGYQAQK